MGAIGGLLGLEGGASGTGFAGPAQAKIQNPVSGQQINDAYSGVQGSMASQQQLLQALQAQQGLQKQNDIYNQYQGIANGTGPNPAQAMLNQSTGQNVANQAALMAGQRGAGANVGLIARQAAQQGANTQQQAAGQGATMQAQQALNAIGQAGNIANTQAGQQIGQTNANTGAQQAEQGQLLGAQAAFNNATTSSQNSVNSANAGLAQTGMQGQQGLIGNAMNAVGFGSGMLKAEGGDIQRMSEGGEPFSAPTGPQSKFGQFLVNQSNVGNPVTVPPQFTEGTSSISKGLGGSNMQRKAAPLPVAQVGVQAPGSALAGGPDNMDLPGGSSGVGSVLAATGGEVDIVVSPGEKVLTPSAVQKVKDGASPMKVGKTVPGKPVVGGAKNSYANDVVPQKAAVGTVVVPRSETKSDDPERNSRTFVAAILAKRKRK